MKITDTSISVAGNAKVASPFRQILLNLAFATTTVATATAAAKAATFKVERRNPIRGTTQIVYEQSLLDIMEMSSIQSHGAIGITTDATKTYIEGSVIIGYDGDIIPAQNEDFLITIGALAVGATADLFALDWKKPATLIMDYSPVRLNAGVPTPVGIADAEYIAMPMATLKLVEFEEPNGRRLTLLPQEVREHLRSLNSMAVNTNGSIMPIGLNYFNFPCRNSVTAYLTHTADTSAIVTRVKPI